MRTLLAVRQHGCVCERFFFKALVHPLERLRGLLWTTPSTRQVALVKCAQIHTFGMGYRIDVAFVASNGVVLDVWRAVPPRKVLGNPRAWITLERPHRYGPWLRAGEQLEIHLSERERRVRGRASQRSHPWAAVRE